MKCCVNWVSAVVAVAGLSVVGIGGYNWATTGCPTGRCADKASEVTAAAATAENKSCCALHEAATKEVAVKEAGHSCSESTACGETTEAKVVKTDNPGCCKNKAKEECCKSEGKSCGGDSCSEKTGEACSEKKEEKKQANDPA